MSCFAFAMAKDIYKLAAVAAGALALKSTLNHFFAFDLKDKTVLIIGGSRGLGLVLAREFARKERASCSARVTKQSFSRRDLISKE